MTTEWPRSVQEEPHFSIQGSDLDPGPDYYQDSSSESIPLLRDSGRSCFRRFWVIFFTVFFFVGLFTGSYLLITEATDWPLSESYYSLITRKGWNAKDRALNVTMPKLKLPVEKVLFTKTNGDECVTEDECSKKVSDVQKDHVQRLAEPDIVYNFLIAGDGQTYEGRGWKYKALISNDNANKTLVVAFLGTFNNSLPTKKQLDQAKHFLEVAENKGKLSECYTIGSEHGSHKNESSGVFHYVVSHLQNYFNKMHDHC